LAQLVYETTDTDFANRALEAMREAGIPCYRTGRGWSSNTTYPGKGFTEDQVCLYIENDTDYVQANQILIRLGAVVEQPPRLPSKAALFLMAIVVAAVVCWLTL